VEFPSSELPRACEVDHIPTRKRTNMKISWACNVHTFLAFIFRTSNHGAPAHKRRLGLLSCVSRCSTDGASGSCGRRRGALLWWGAVA